MSILIPAVPALPITKPEFSALYLNQLNNVLRLYFNLLNNAVAELNSAIIALETNGGGVLLSFPYAAFHDTTTFTATSTTIAYVIPLSNVDYANHITVQSGTQAKVAYAGIYNLQFSVQISNPNAAIANVSIWYKKNGVNLAESAGTNGVPAKYGSLNGLQVVGWNQIVQLAADDYIELWWHSDTTNVQVITFSPTTVPDVPQSPGAVFTITYVSSLTV